MSENWRETIIYLSKISHCHFKPVVYFARIKAYTSNTSSCFNTHFGRNPPVIICASLLAVIKRNVYGGGAGRHCRTHFDGPGGFWQYSCRSTIIWGKAFCCACAKHVRVLCRTVWRCQDQWSYHIHFTTFAIPVLALSDASACIFITWKCVIR